MRKKLEAIQAQLEELVSDAEEEAVGDEDAEEGEEEQERADRYDIVAETLQRAVDEIDKVLTMLND